MCAGATRTTRERIVFCIQQLRSATASDADKESAALTLGGIFQNHENRARYTVESANAANALIVALDDPSREVRRSAVAAWGNINPADAALPLIQRCDTEKDPRVQIALVQVLGTLRDDRAAPCLSRFVQKGNISLRAAALNSLGSIYTPAYHDVIIACLQDQAETLRIVAADICAAHQITDAIEPLKQNALNPTAEVRFSAVNAIGALGSSADMRLLQQMRSNEKDLRVRNAIEQAMKNLGSKRIQP
jgi:HEAT repeat protein